MWTRRALEPLVLGAFIGTLMIDPGNALSSLTEDLLTVMTNEDVAWVIMVCGLMGSIIALLLKSGSSRAFADKLMRYTTSKPRALLGCWIMGIILFVDDYLNSLAVGTSMRKVTDRFKTSREMLAYVVDSTASPVATLAALQCSPRKRLPQWSEKNESLRYYHRTMDYREIDGSSSQ